MDFDYADWLAQRKRDVEEQRAEELDGFRFDPEPWQESRALDRYEAERYDRDDVG